MMLSAILTALIGFVSAIVGTAISHRYIQARANREFAERYRNRLFDKQLAAYEALWKGLAPTSTDTSDQTIFCGGGSESKFNRTVAERFCDDLTRTFFLEHGLYLSKSTRQALFSTRNLLRKSLATPLQKETFCS